MARITNIQLRRDTAANWTSASPSPTLAAGEIGFETDTGKFKIGDGTSAWSSLTYATDGSKMTGTTLAPNVVNSSITKVGLNTAGAVITDASGNLSSGVLPISQGGTGATTVAGALGNIGGSVFIPFASGGYYRSATAASTGVAATVNTTYYVPVYVGATTMFDTLNASASTVTTAGNIRLGIYADTNGTPSTLILDTGSSAFATSTTVVTANISNVSVTAAVGSGGIVTYTANNSYVAGQTVSITGLGVASGSSLNLTSVTISSATSTQFIVNNATVGVSSGTGTSTGISLNPGWYWLAFNQQSGSSTWIGTTANQTVTSQRMLSGTSTFVVTNYSQSSVSGSFANASSPTAASTAAPFAFLRAL
jgi:hypothetical protein